MHPAHRDFCNAPKWRGRRLSQHASDRHLQPADESCHDQYHNLYVDRTGHYARDRSSNVRCVNRDLHTIEPSRAEHPLYRHDYHGGTGSRWQSASKQLCMDLHHK